MLVKVLKIIGKVVLMPVVLIITLVCCVISFSHFISSWVFYTLSMIISITAVGCWGFELDPITEVKKMFVAAFVVFMIPTLAEVLVTVLVAIKVRIMSWIFG